jgi:hypothetical protein
MLKAVFGLILFVGLICIVDLEASTPPFCGSIDSSQTTANLSNENCAPLSRAVITYGRDFAIAVGHFIHDFNPEIVAISR